MSEHSKWVKGSIKDLYRVRDSYVDRSKMYRMDRNERTWPVSDEIIKEIRERISSDTLTNYPEVDGIYNRIAKHLGVDSDQIYLHSGSDLVIKSIYETYIGVGDKILMQNPTYAMYSVYAKMYQAEIHAFRYDDDLQFSVDDYCKEIKAVRPKMVILENPSGYIGNSYSHDQVQKVVETSRNCDSLVLVDEAYIDYIMGSSVLDLLEKYENLIIVRTFSKAWGLAGLRAGYAISNKLLISEIFKVMPMHELTSATIIALDVLLEHKDDIFPYIEEVKRVREYCLEEMDKLGIKYIESDTHFITACLGEVLNTDKFRENAHENRFFVRRSFGQDFLRKWVRIGLLPMEEMVSFMQFLAHEIQKAGQDYE